ncbi:MAG: hypothetical protein K9I85_14100 [Saprospiraceae bacterium]|nr:hypothetical protein [Saprospiraceae bacterium]
MNTQLKDPPVQKDLTRMEKMQAFFEELEVQMALGRKDFQELWMRDMKDMRRFFHEEKNLLHEDQKKFQDTWDRIVKAVDAMDGTMDKVEHDIDKVWNKQKPNLELRISDLRKELKDTGEEFSNIFADAIDRFQNQRDNPHREFHDEHPQSLDDRMDILKKKVQEFQHDFKEKLPADEKITAFKKEVGDSFDRMKKAFHDLFA